MKKSFLKDSIDNKKNGDKKKEIKKMKETFIRKDADSAKSVFNVVAHNNISCFVILANETQNANLSGMDHFCGAPNGGSIQQQCVVVVVVAVIVLDDTFVFNDAIVGDVVIVDVIGFLSFSIAVVSVFDSLDDGIFLTTKFSNPCFDNFVVLLSVFVSTKFPIVVKLSFAFDLSFGVMLNFCFSFKPKVVAKCCVVCVLYPNATTAIASFFACANVVLLAA